MAGESARRRSSGWCEYVVVHGVLRVVFGGGFFGVWVGGGFWWGVWLEDTTSRVISYLYGNRSRYHRFEDFYDTYCSYRKCYLPLKKKGGRTATEE